MNSNTPENCNKTPWDGLTPPAKTPTDQTDPAQAKVVTAENRDSGGATNRAEGSVFARVRHYLSQPSRRFARHYAGTRFKLLIWLACIFIAACTFLFFLLDSVIMPRVIRHGSEFALPNIVGKPITEAEKLLTENHVRLQITSQEYNPAFPEGTALSQYPIAGTMVKDGRIVKVVTSLGKKDVIVPPISGASIRQAQLDLETVGLKLGDISWTYTDTLPENMVVFSFPHQGEKISIGSKVNLMVNRGRGQGLVNMPNVIGKPLDDATIELKKLGLKVGKVKRQKNNRYLPETVLEQSVEPDEELETGDEVNLVVSKTD